MSGDSLLTLTIQILGFLIVAVGILLALYPLEKKKYKVACFIGFAVIGLAVVVLSTVQSHHSSREQAELRGQIDRIQKDNRRDFDDIQARLDAVVLAVRNSPQNVNIKKLSEKVVRLSKPAAPENLMGSVRLLRPIVPRNIVQQAMPPGDLIVAVQQETPLPFGNLVQQSKPPTADAVVQQTRPNPPSNLTVVVQ
jgi:hypothetical protein